jgi:hypothetical protein
MERADATTTAPRSAAHAPSLVLARGEPARIPLPRSLRADDELGPTDDKPQLLGLPPKAFYFTAAPPAALSEDEKLSHAQPAAGASADDEWQHFWRQSEELSPQQFEVACYVHRCLLTHESAEDATHAWRWQSPDWWTLQSQYGFAPASNLTAGLYAHARWEGGGCYDDWDANTWFSERADRRIGNRETEWDRPDAATSFERKEDDGYSFSCQ